MDFADHEAIGRNIMYFRERRNISQQELADALDVSQPIVARIESGDRRLDVEEFQSIANALGLDDLTRLVNRQRPARQLTYETMLERVDMNGQELVMGLDETGDPLSYTLSEIGHLLLIGDTGSERLTALRQWMLQAVRELDGRIIVVENEHSSDFANLPNSDQIERYTDPDKLAERLEDVQTQLDKRLETLQDKQLETLYNLPPDEVEPVLLMLNEAGEYWLPDGFERSSGIFDPVRRIIQAGPSLAYHTVVSMRGEELTDLPPRLLGSFETRVMTRYGNRETARELAETEAPAFLPPGYALCWHNHRQETVQLPHLTPEEMTDVLNNHQ